ncbi:hypothetical protein FRC09_003250 [Ceratobasidium sp. 395]|nr:hypothetical protein FRC09_003250 [Ceratobasidium sp. 395]
MKFHLAWRHKDCPVMGWYHQQVQSSTKFWSIEHCRNIEGPFYHEFLLLKLTDGNVCRVERVGDGSRADAVRYIGCPAHDLIQWFSSPDYEIFSAKSPSERLAEVNLGQEFDILDVLAICYSIQNTKRCCRYTLQRYNCYFLCLTVLVVLTRRVASWETRINLDGWDSCLDSMLEDLRNLSPEDSRKHPILAICAHPEPESPQRAQFVFSFLQSHLRAQAGGFKQCREAVKLMLWQANREFALRSVVAESIKGVPDTFRDPGYCSQQLKRAISSSIEDSNLAISSSGTLGQDYSKIYAEEIATVLNKVQNIYRNLWRMWQIEHPISFSKFALNRLLGTLAAMPFPLSPANTYKDSSFDHRLTSQVPMRVAVFKYDSWRLSAPLLDRLDDPDAAERLWNRAGSIVINEVGGTITVRILDRLVSRGLLTPSEVPLVLANQLDGSLGLAELLAELAAPGLNRMLTLVTEENQTKIRLTLYVQGNLELSKMSMKIGNFQDRYIKRRIAAHAKRVDTHQLAAAEFVVKDIEETMEKVWKGLPSGFGAVALEIESALERQGSGSTAE